MKCIWSGDISVSVIHLAFVVVCCSFFLTKSLIIANFNLTVSSAMICCEKAEALDLADRLLLTY